MKLIKIKVVHVRQYLAELTSLEPCTIRLGFIISCIKLIIQIILKTFNYSLFGIIS